MPKFLFVLLMAGLIFSLTACSRATPETTIAGAQNQVNQESIDAASTVKLLNGKILGGLTRIVSEKENEKIYEDLYKNNFGLELDLAGVIYADSIADGLLLLRSQKIAGFEILGATAHYIVQNNTDLKMYIQEFQPSTVHMLFNMDKKEQCEQVDTAVKTMLEDGTVDKLKAWWIDNLPMNAEHASVHIPLMQGSETLKVGVTGNEPPLDYVAANSLPSGYSVAVLCEISRRANLNMELVTVDTADRFDALQSGKIEAFLWKTELKSMAAYIQDPTFEDIDPGKYLMSYPYLETTRAIIVLK